MSTFVIALASIFLSVAAQFCLKAGMSSQEVKTVLAQPLGLHTMQVVGLNLPILGGFVLYGLGAVVWLLVLSQWEVSKAYPLVGMGFLFTLVVGLLLGEQVTLFRVVGVMMISAGVWMVANS